MQATTMGGAKLDKRYSPSFRDDAAAVPVRKMSASKRKRDEVLRWVLHVHSNAENHTHNHYFLAE